jgi:glyoxylase-like metal-dependent hydrolase (beta-lactamase superfamily II)
MPIASRQNDRPTLQMENMRYEVDVLIHGFPGRSVCHGGLGWSTITLLRGFGRVALIDVGAFGVRKPLTRQLTARGVNPDEVTDVVLTHAHYDHVVNFTLFPKARVWIGHDELEWAAAAPAGFNPLPELYVRELSQSARVHKLRPGDEFLPGMQAIAAPGHTPGHLIFTVEDSLRPVLFTGDAAKNRAELLSRKVADSDEMADSLQSIDLIWQCWRERPGTVLIPGHDLPMRLDSAGAPHYLAEREAGIAAWFAEDFGQTTFIDLCQAGRTVETTPVGEGIFTALVQRQDHSHGTF